MKLLLCLIVFTSLLHAQAPTHTPDGRVFEHLQSVTILPKPSAPFSATVTTEWTRSLADGTTVTLKNHRTVARDSTGRIFQERRYLTPDGDRQESAITALEYFDPISHELLTCSPATRICRVFPWTAPATVAASLPTSGKLPNGTGSFSRESLGDRTTANLATTGSREITTLDAGGSTGYANPEPTIKEFWFSPRLEINLITRRFEPRGGAQAFVFSNVDVSEPDPRLFEPPAGVQGRPYRDSVIAFRG